MKSLSVVIIGGGLGGLALAQSLKKNHIDFHVCEREHEDNLSLGKKRPLWFCWETLCTP